MNTNNAKNKRSLLLMVGIFALPVIVAYAALKLDWFNKASTNRGELLQPVLEASSVIGSSGDLWHLLYVVPKICEQACENAILSVRQTYQATGKESDRVGILFIQTENSSIEAIDKIRSFTNYKLILKSQKDVNNLFKKIDLNAIFISDTQHNVVLRYPVTADQQQAIMDSRDILADLKKLLKLSRIG